MFYYLSIGTNIAPEENAGKIVRLLSKYFGEIYLFPFIYTEPQNIATENPFLNSVAILQSALSERELKDILNNIETTLGRDRNNPKRSVSDRPADIDIIATHREFDLDALKHVSESYIKDVYELKEEGVNLQQSGIPFNPMPSKLWLDESNNALCEITN